LPGSSDHVLSLLPVSVKLRTVAALMSVPALFATAGCGLSDQPGKAGNGEAGQAAAAAAPVLPDEAKKRTPAGEESFARYFFATVNHAFASGKTDALVPLSAPTCQICRATIGDISYAFARGQIRGGDVTIQKIGPAKKADGFSNRLVTYSEETYEEVDGAGKVLYAQPAKKGYQMVVKLTWTGSGWQVAQLNRHGRAAT